MSIRSIEQLRVNQSAILDDYRARRSAVAATGASGVSSGVETVATLGRVTGVVTVDATYGPHLTVAVQEFAGTPPFASDAAKPIQRANPTPNHVVADYAVNEFVELLPARGALLASKLQ